MPANLTPQYQKAENAYRQAQSAGERVECLEEMLAIIPKHKGTDKLQADLRKRLKEARAESTSEQSSEKKSRSYKVPRQGAGQVVLVGGPNAGKSRVVEELTNASPEVTDYPFATREPLPAMMSWEDITVQLIDTPPVTETHIDAYLTGLVRAADLALLVFDGSSDDAPDDTEAVIRQFTERKTLFSNRTGFDEDDFSTVHVRTLLVVTRASDPDAGTRISLFEELTESEHETVRVELDNPDSCDSLREIVYRKLDVIRVYTKRPGKTADFESPFTVPRNATVEDLALRVHRELATTLKFARIWGDTVHDGQSVGREHVLSDKDLVELHA